MRGARDEGRGRGFPRPGFYGFLEGLVDGGLANRVMFDSDQMVWPETIERGIAVIEEAPFLNDQRKRDILYNYAARFLRLDDEEIARHHGRSQGEPAPGSRSRRRASLLCFGPGEREKGARRAARSMLAATQSL